MKKASLLFIFTVILTSLGHSQPPDKKNHKEIREQIRAQKIAFISTQLNLTAEEAQKFWPVYNKYEAEMDAVRDEKRKYLRELKKSESTLTADRAYELTEKIFLTEKKEADIRLSYLNQFSIILGKKKASMVFIAEDKFKHELLDQLKRDGKMPPPPVGDEK